jgi:hypothetical protein
MRAAGRRLGRGDQRQPPALGRRRHVHLLVAGRQAEALGQQPDLQEVGGLGLRVVELAVADPRARGHALHVARDDHPRVGAARLAVSHAVRMRQGAVEDVADDLHVAVAVRAEAGARRDGVVVEDAQVAEAHVRRVVVVGEREAVVAVEPAVVGVAAVAGLAEGEHRGSPVVAMDVVSVRRSLRPRAPPRAQTIRTQH